MNPYKFLTIALSIWSVATFCIWYYEYREYTYSGKYDTIPFKSDDILEYKTNYYYSNEHVETVYHHTRTISDSYQPQNTVGKYISLFGYKYNSFEQYLCFRLPLILVILFPMLGMISCVFDELKKDWLKKKSQ